MCAYQGVRNVGFSENFAFILNECFIWLYFSKAPPSRCSTSYLFCKIFLSLTGNDLSRIPFLRTCHYDAQSFENRCFIKHLRMTASKFFPLWAFNGQSRQANCRLYHVKEVIIFVDKVCKNCRTDYFSRYSIHGSII